MRNSICRVVTAATLTIAMLPLPGMAGSKAPAPSASPVDLVWPTPPDKPRVRFLEMWGNNLQIEPIKKRGFLDKLAGIGDPNRLEQFEKPAGVAVDSKGRLYIAAMGTATVYILDKDHRQLFRLKGDAGVRFRCPLGLAVDSHDNIYVSDPQLKAVFKFDPQFHLLATFGGNEKLVNPSYIALDEPRNRILVVDTRGGQVVAYALDSLKPVGAIQTFGPKDKMTFSYPVGVGVNRSDGMIAITDTGSCSVKLFDSTFKYIRSFGKQMMTPGNFVRPKGVQFDSEGNIWVADAAFNNFQVFNQKGQVLMFVGSPGFGPGQFQLPNGLFIDKNNKVYVADQLNYRVQVFQFLGGQ